MPSKNFLTPFALLVLALTAQGAYAQGEDARYEIVEVEGGEGQVEIEVPDAPVYEITARNTAHCAWCQCRAPQPGEMQWSVLPVADADAYRTPLHPPP